MGMFDRVMTKCPNCKRPVEFQSKSGPCNLKNYSAESLPAHVAIGVVGDVEACECGVRIRLVGQTQKVKLTPQIVTDDEDGDDFDPKDFLGG